MQRRTDLDIPTLDWSGAAMRYDPQTVWSSTLAWMLRYVDDGAAREGAPLARSHLLRVYVYAREREGCYYLAGPRLSWMEDPPAGEISNIDQHDLAQSADQLGHVIAVNPVTREERFWPTWKAFADETGLSKL